MVSIVSNCMLNSKRRFKTLVHPGSGFGVRVSVMFHFMFVHYTLSSSWAADRPPFGK